MGDAENKVQKEILDYINLMPDSIAFRINNKGLNKQRKSTLPLGFPDIVGYTQSCLGVPLPLFIEVKASGKVCTDTNQLEFLADRKKDGCIAFWCNSFKMFTEKIYEPR